MLAAREAGVLVLLKRKRDAAIAIVRDGEGRIMADRWVPTPVTSATWKPSPENSGPGNSSAGHVEGEPIRWRRSVPSSG